MSNWENQVLSGAQIHYAAQDAWASCWLLFRLFHRCVVRGLTNAPSRGMRRETPVGLCLVGRLEKESYLSRATRYRAKKI